MKASNLIFFYTHIDYKSISLQNKGQIKLKDMFELFCATISILFTSTTITLSKETYVISLMFIIQFCLKLAYLVLYFNNTLLQRTGAIISRKQA